MLFNQVCLCRFLSPSGDRNVSSPPYREGSCHMGVLSPAFGKKRGGQDALPSCCFPGSPWLGVVLMPERIFWRGIFCLPLKLGAENRG